MGRRTPAKEHISLYSSYTANELAVEHHIFLVRLRHLVTSGLKRGLEIAEAFQESILCRNSLFIQSPCPMMFMWHFPAFIYIYMYIPEPSIVSFISAPPLVRTWILGSYLKSLFVPFIFASFVFCGFELFLILHSYLVAIWIKRHMLKIGLDWSSVNCFAGPHHSDGSKLSYPRVAKQRCTIAQGPVSSSFFTNERFLQNVLEIWVRTWFFSYLKCK